VVRAAPMNVACVPRSLIEEKPAAPTPRPRVVVAATDLSTLGDAAVPLAYGLVADGGKVHLVHVVEAGPFTHLAARARDAELVTRLAERAIKDSAGRRVHTESHVLFGRPADELVGFVERVGADAIAVGSRGRSGIGAAVLGSVSQEVIARSNCPVIVVPAPRE
jgi:nucleotide-binding universal stress UspA family protein